MKKQSIAGATLTAVVLLGMAGVWKLQKRIDAQRRAIHLDADELMLRSGGTVKKLSLEYAPLMGAIYWTRAVQYYGEKHRLHDQNLELLWPLLDITTTLDPNLIAAYRFGSTFLSDAPPRGAGRPDLAAQLLQRGIQANPDAWRLYQDLGNVYYFDAKDYLKASAAFEEGGKNPKAQIWMKVMAAKIAADGESLETSLFLWKQVYAATKDQMVKDNAVSHIKLVTAELDCREISRLADEFQKQTGRRTNRISELVQAGLLKKIPVDPEGYPYVLGEGGKGELNLNSPLLEQQLLEDRNKAVLPR